MNGDTIGDSTRIIERARARLPRAAAVPGRARRAPPRPGARGVLRRGARAPHPARCVRGGDARSRGVRLGRRSDRRAGLVHAGLQGDGRAAPGRCCACATASTTRPPRGGWEKTTAAMDRLESEIGPGGLPRRRQLHGRGPDRGRAVLPARAARRGPVPDCRSRCPQASSQRRGASWPARPGSSGCRRCTAATAASRPKSRP